MDKGKVVAIGAVIALAAILVAFGPAPDREGTGNTLVVAAVSPPDSIDPGVSYMGVSWTMQINAYNGLLTYKKTSGPEATDLIPDLAEAMPTITNGGKKLTFKVRKGVMFGPPLNREVMPSDLKYTIDRNAKLPSPGAFYYSVVKGFDEVAKTRKGSVSGVVADDKARTITFNLVRPDATFLYVLGMPFSYAVPKGTPAKDQSQSGFVPPTGPYMFKEFDPSREVIMVRNPAYKQWSEATPPGNVDRIHVKLGVSDDNAITQIQQGSVDAMMGAIPRSKLPMLLESEEWQPYIHEHELARTSYIWMNTQVKPFDNVKVRQAVNWAINRRAMVKLGGGAGVPSSTILPPTMPGYTGHEVYPEQDLEKAKQLIAESGVQPGKLVIWCFTAPPSPELAQYLQEQLRILGFDARTRCVDSSAYYGLVGNKKTQAQIGFGSWGQDFPEGSNFIDVLLNGAYINPEHSNNLAWYTGKDKELARISQLLDLDERAKEWGRLDKEIVEDGAWAPISHSIQRTLVGKRVGDYTYHPVYDLLYTKVTVDGSGTPQTEGELDRVSTESPDEDAAGEEE